ncbi:dTDP-4-dehydrorhamnose reductase [Lentibacter algarum]|uniref:dTDP-4-dehydrorhamnose reductase n=1 Tax=Lentibacter algarum TaxID=576131 RepID=UPI001C06FD3F|nr:dTDP-4-dehydrorhamnose reductase [Lentibacter algarum]MBU2980341.1 dTDP-4-dehydrorhamnose reductase [Lentibacter algarum]
MSVLVFGKTGQVAQELWSAHPEYIYLGRDDADLSNPETCAEAIKTLKPSAVINAAAYTAVDRAEEEEELALLINAKAPEAMAKACAALSVPFIHISTDYVFDGTGKDAQSPDKPTAPVNAYGQTKLAGETAIRNSGVKYAILRTSWVFSAHGSNFAKSMLRLSESRSELGIVADQIGGPTPAADIASTCALLARNLKTSGTYHFSGAPDVSWADFAREIFAQAGRDVTVTDIKTADYPTPAKRPLNSRLDCASLMSDFGVIRPSWKHGLAEVLKELK